MTKKAVYAKNNEIHRIAHVGSDQWRRQEYFGIGSKTYDPWHNMSPVMTREEAEVSIKRFNREKIV